MTWLAFGVLFVVARARARAFARRGRCGETFVAIFLLFCSSLNIFSLGCSQPSFGIFSVLFFRSNLPFSQPAGILSPSWLCLFWRFRLNYSNSLNILPLHAPYALYTHTHACHILVSLSACPALPAPALPIQTLSTSFVWLKSIKTKGVAKFLLWLRERFCRLSQHGGRTFSVAWYLMYPQFISSNSSWLGVRFLGQFGCYV